MHVYRVFYGPNADNYVDCNTGEIYDQLVRPAYIHRSFETFLNYMTMPAVEYSRKHWATPVLLEEI